MITKDTVLKQCVNCKQAKEPGEFYKDKSRRDGLAVRCKSCAKIISSKWYRENPERAQAYRKEYWRNNTPPRVRLSPDYNTDIFKRCCKCKEVLPKTEFHKNRNTKDGLTSYCKRCCYKPKSLPRGARAIQSGQRFGLLVTVESGRDKWGHTEWLCKCDCGGTKKVTSSDLFRKNTTNCGCNHGRGSRPPSNDSNFNAVYSEYKVGATRRGLEWGLTKEQALELFKGSCFYCGVPSSRTKFEHKSSPPFTCNGIDRMNPRFGYIPGNCASCCSNCNYIKGTMTSEEFEDYIIKVYNNLIKRNRK